MSPNVTSWCHPMDHGDIQTMKKKYRWILVQSLAGVVGGGGGVSMYVKKLNSILLIGHPKIARESKKTQMWSCSKLPAEGEKQTESKVTEDTVKENCEILFLY